MRRILKSTAALAVALAAASPAFSAEKIIPEESTIEVMLLRQKSVRADLGLSENAADAIARYASGQWKKAEDVEKMSAREQDARYAEMTKENEAFLNKTLDKKQRERLEQITLQYAGLLYVTSPPIAAKLKLTEEQKKKAQGVQKEARTEMEELIHTAHEKSVDREKKLTELRETCRKRLTGILTDEQRAKWKELTGEPFKGKFDFAVKQAAKE